MKPPRFAYHDPTTVAEALELKAEHGFDATILAGGQSLVPMLNMRLASPDVLIDVNGIADLQQVTQGDGTVTFGAGVRQHVLETRDDLATAVPLLALAAPHIGHVENRHRGTIGGSIAHADSAAELPVVAATLDAEVVVAGPDGTRTIAANDFFLGWMTTALEPEELVVGVRFPIGGPDDGYGLAEVARRQGDFAIALAAARVTLASDGSVGSAALGLGGVAAQPLRATEVETALVGEQPTSDAIDAAAEAVADLVTTGDDLHATHVYRQQVAKVVTRRSLHAAVDQAKEAGR